MHWMEKHTQIDSRDQELESGLELAGPNQVLVEEHQNQEMVQISLAERSEQFQETPGLADRRP